MGKKVGLANQEYRKYLVHLVSVVTQAIQVLKVRGVPLPSGHQALLVHLERVVRKESPETLLWPPRAHRKEGSHRNAGASEATQVIRGLQGQLACPDSRVSKARKAEREVLGFPVSLVHLAIPVKEALPDHQGNQDSPGLLAVQVPQVGKDSEEIWDLLDQLG
ncbi:LOW QUALITY PROTEIN: hypothetical protein QTO34_002731 [Cnephaeus nilssonii]|uniref:Uncharacterized protein n=1 Tax=Cnephaeus nilssonii TaxID=3371016 RepID=A0AA40HTJ5_CNENI|nr:LOW QUALITY PROTEIN: hypothetical protein QTO34_002731 [Eptesicus nilssonii]